MIILTGGSDCSHGECRWQVTKEVRRVADSAGMGRLPVGHIVSAVTERMQTAGRRMVFWGQEAIVQSMIAMLSLIAWRALP